MSNLEELKAVRYYLIGLVDEASEEEKAKVQVAREKTRLILDSDEATIGVLIEVLGHLDDIGGTK